GVDRSETSFNPLLLPLLLIRTPYDHTHHFDRPKGQTSAQVFVDSWKYLYGRRQEVVSWLSDPQDDPGRTQKALAELGKALHALQDAYSHSNYVDPGSFGMGTRFQMILDDALQSNPANPVPTTNEINALNAQLHLTLFDIPLFPGFPG